MLEVSPTLLVVTDYPAETGRAERALGARIRAARGSGAGQLFTPSISAEFRKVLMLEVTADRWVAIMDENPGLFSYRINDGYPKEKEHSTMPAGLLAVLPPLPDDVQYRFVGRTLILLDTRADVILDRISCALTCDRRE
jgi:hypothetical protein